MCEMCVKMEKSYGKEVAESIADSLHVLEELVDWTQKAKDLFVGNMKEVENGNVHLAKANLTSAVGALAQMNFIFIDTILSGASFDFIHFIIKLIISLREEQIEDKKTEGTVASAKMRKLKMFLEELVLEKQGKTASSNYFFN